jgi:hypothetical protein
VKTTKAKLCVEDDALDLPDPDHTKTRPATSRHGSLIIGLKKR